MVSDGNSVSQPFVVTSLGLLDTYAVCDNQNHKVEFRIMRQGVQFQVDGSVPRSYGYPTQFRFVPLINTPIYLGGIPTGQFIA